jgi:hypothetical protein
MSVAARPFVIGGSALIASSLIAVTPVVAPPDLPHLSNAAVRLVDANGSLGDLGGLSSIFGDLTSAGGLFGDGSLLNIPYNIFADIVNIPYTESQALAEYAYALGPAGSTGGVDGWIAPGTPSDAISESGQYMDGGTGSWWMESMGNTWGWDNGNWPQVDAIMHFILPLQWTEGLAESVQSIAQSSFIDGSAVNCEFQCSDLLGYLGGWITHLGNVFSSTYPTTVTDTIGGTDTTAIWSGQPVTINPLLETFQAIWQNAVESPSSNPIELPNLADVFGNVAKLGQDLINDFDPFVEGSFVYWGADSLYSIPSVIGGLVHDVSLGLIPNEFVLAGNGAEPVDGSSQGPAQLLGNLEQGLQFLLHGADGDHGLLGYLEPSTWAASTADASTAAAASADASTAAAASADASTLFGSLGDHGGLLADLSSAMPNLSTDLASMFPHLTADLSSWFPDMAAALIP